MNFNRVMIGGNLTRDPESRDAGKSTVCKFGIAVNRTYRKGDEKQQETTFLDCEAWGRVGEMIQQYVGKGDKLFVEGRLKQDQWEDQNGNRRSKVLVVVENMQLLGGPGRKDSEPRDTEAPF